MNKKLFTAAMAVSAFGLSTAAHALPVITVVPASAPNQFGSPSYGTWEDNAVQALELGLPVNGGVRATNPTAYEAAPAVIQPGENIVTGFPSWRGQANPSGAFANELGNRVLFGLRIIDATDTFALENVSSVGTSSDGILDYSFDDFEGFSYGDLNAVGVFYGSDGIKGTLDDMRYTGVGDSVSLPVNEVYYSGDGNALTPDSDPTSDVTFAQRQAAIQTQADVYGNSQPFFFTGTYTLGVGGPSGSGTVTIVPEPASLGLIAGAGLIGLRRRR